MILETPESEEIKLEMTSMIDIVFQLLVFFILTFKVAVMEGDFSIKMPLGSQSASFEEVLPEIIHVQLRAGENGGIAEVSVEGNILQDKDVFAALNQDIEQRLGAAGDPENNTDTELEFDIDRKLKYIYTVKAIDAVSGKVDGERNVTKLIEKIKFKDNSSL